MSHGRALAWELISRHRWGLTAVAAYAPALVLLRAFVLPDLTPANETTFAFTVIVPLGAALFYLLVVFTFGTEGDLAGRASLFPGRLCRLPISTTALTAWFLLFSATTVVALWVVTWFAALRPVGVNLPFLWPALFLAAFIWWVQALTWLPYGLPWLRVLLTLACLTTVDFAAIAAIHYQVSETLMIAVVAPLVPLAFLTARFALARARRGDVPDWRGGFARRRARTTGEAGALRPFGSAARAQLWFEWRWHGGALPTVVALLLPIELLLLFAARDAPTLVAEIVLGAVLTPVLMAPFVAATVRKSSGGAADAHRLTAFQATRPLTSAALIAPKLAVAAGSTVLAFMLVGLSVPAALGLSDTGHLVRGMWDDVRAAIGTPRAVAAALIGIALLVTTTWKQLVQSLYVGLSGRPWLVRSYMSLVLVGLFAAIPAFKWVHGNRTVLVALWHAVPWVATVAVTAKLGVATWLAVRLQRSDLLDGRTLVAGAATWLAGVLAVYAVLAWFFESPFIPNGLLMSAAILVVPLARLSAAPIALAGNRHR